MRKGQVRSLVEFSLDLFVSVFAGMMVFLTINDFEYSEYLKAFCISMGAFMGRETLLIIQKVFIKKIGIKNE